MASNPDPAENSPISWAGVLEASTPDIRQLAREAQDTVRAAMPDAVEEADVSARMLGYTYAPGTYKGLIVTIALHRAHINIMFSRGVELADEDTGGLLEGTGKRARHIKITDAEQLADPRVTDLLTAAAALTPRAQP
ncbi:DUF1801 domain-containing protein [Streptomyces sp. NPDC059193]|uniref:DUF1801 domain-containing protein n=1 Tax=Streptomyces sp. NPDC059193 TaxID=3346763 RepID=UPI003691D751